MRAYKEIIRKYYKTYVQPTNPTGISATSGWSNATNAFDNNDSTYARCNSLTDYIEWNIGEDIVLTGVNTVGNWVNAQAVATNFIVKSVEADGTEKTILRTIGASNTSTYYTKGDCSPVLVNKLRFYIETTYPNAPSRTVQINLNTIPKESTEDDYDFYKDVAIYKVPKEIIRKYYKYGATISIPQYASQTEAETGKNGVKIISGSYLWQIFGNTTTSTKYSWNHEGNRIAIIDFGAICELLTYNFRGQGAVNQAYDVDMYPIEGSNDGVEWYAIDSNKRQTSYSGTFKSGIRFRYIRVTFHHTYSDSGHSTYGCWLQYFNMNVKQILEGSLDDYDYYIDTPTYYGINQ